MPKLHLIKLCVGVTAPEELEGHFMRRLEQAKAEGREGEIKHTTRMVPKRCEELLAGGSLYWVMAGQVQCRQRLLDIRIFHDDEGIRRCDLVLEAHLVRTRHQPRRAFQGWRYLRAEDAPEDWATGVADADMPAHMRTQLAELGLL